MIRKNRKIMIGGALAGIALAILLMLAVFKLFDPSWNHMIDFGYTSIDLAFLALFVVYLFFFTAYIVFIIQGFRTHWGWGVANLPVPPAIIVFFFAYPRKSRDL